MSDLSVINYINLRISTSKTEEAKATNNFIQGIPDSLECFFQNLEFVLKGGALSEYKDVNGDGLPAELQGLKAFLDNPFRKAGEAYYLQRNETERYHFSWQGDLKLTVNRETLYVPETTVRSGYTGVNTWRTETTTQNVEANSVLSIFDRNETVTTALPKETQASVMSILDDGRLSMDDSLESLKNTLTAFQKLRKQSGEPDKFVPKLTIKRSERGDAVHVNFCVNGESVRETSYSLSGKRADLRGADLRGADLIGADLIGADLIGADLIGADLTKADLRGADLTKADLIGADLRGAYLIGADLTKADLWNADLTNADLTNADLTDADLTDAKLSGADL
ncbi:TPA: pentapeptide repeat-containing protein, partial [Escherichia coli]